MNGIQNGFFNGLPTSAFGTIFVYGQGLFSDGSATAPSISFINEKTTGFYRPLSGVVSLTSSASASVFRIENATESAIVFRVGASDLGFLSGNAGNFSVGGYLAANVDIYANGSNPANRVARFNTAGNVLIGTTTDSGNGKLQLASHTTSAGGIGFGDTPLYRSSTGVLQLNISQASPSGFSVINSNASGYSFFNFQSESESSDIGIGGSTASVTALRRAFYLYDNSRAKTRFAIYLNDGGSAVFNDAAIATTATNGFVYIPSCPGAPTGVPTTYAGRIPLVVDSTNNKLYFYSGGAWRDAGP